MGRLRLLRAGDVLIYRVCEDITEALVYLMVVFSPWAFGTTLAWSVWTMNFAGFFLGALWRSSWPFVDSRDTVRRAGTSPRRRAGSKEREAGSRERRAT